MFHFEVENGLNVSLVFFIDDLQSDSTTLEETFEVTYQNYHRPDQVVCIIPCDNKEHFKAMFERETVKINAQRYGNKVPFIATSFDVSGKLEVFYKSIEPDSFSLNELESQLKCVGLELLAKTNQVIECSPPGTSFLKPSQSNNKEFISAHKLGQSSSQNTFIAYALLPYLVNHSDIEQVYVDTSAINYIVLSIVNLVNRLEGSNKFNPSYKSFHSYSGVEVCRPQLTNNAFVIISASTSNSLMNKIVNSWKLDVDQVITILSFKKSDRVLCHLEHTNSRNQNYVGNLVRRVDEYFTTEYFSPKPVVLKKIQHGSGLGKWPFKPFHNSNNHKCNSIKSSGDSIKEQSLTLESLPMEVEKALNEWVDHIINWHIPFSLKYIVTDESYEFCNKFVQKIRRSHSEIKVVKFEEVIELDFDNCTGALCSLLPVIRSGNSLMSLNRDLRIAKHDGMRVFIAPFFLYHGINGREQFRKSLCPLPL
ncbi:hypothetical protein [Pseudoalteromonas sp. Of11M-6]|uniref:hypothetical protein n=1 Tax=Pseudoalteromonas sp. Of11M-6 TaxID=2917754 RepID=UPI001EF6FE5F|nr:hypothetical protein [Pseudoalteromonas sp. Of11M-6]MCG7555918.1 hypothetical protein [Pseudoalteromonas sp. Of11M-6]